jgi:hypothetical protein
MRGVLFSTALCAEPTSRKIGEKWGTRELQLASFFCVERNVKMQEIAGSIS